jgi:GTPase Era involved in 16S rRNA processing
MGKWGVGSCSRFSFLCKVLREKVFRRFFMELPYKLQIEDESVKELKDGSIRIEKNLLVPSAKASALLC